jgi:16S rRNA C967 or C1407 C5-methylase (RsmB/RsmF family)/NOL1/NOP2/fmu family ribosome biogenesis protein
MKGEIPKEFRERIDNQSYIDKESLLSALSLNPEVSIRINTAKWGGTPEDRDRVPWCETGYYLGRRPQFTLDPLLHAGCYYVQESSSMFLEQAVKQAGADLEGLRILDLCAAPGGKTTHLSSLAGKGTVVVANEVVRARASILAENVVKWGRGNTIVTSSDPEAFGRLGGYFDMIVVDAPCSGEGMFRELSVRDEWSEDNCSLCSGRQWRIIADVWPSLKEGGHLIYSTCTFNPDENEKQIQRLLSEFPCSSVALKHSAFNGITPVPTKKVALGYGFHPGKVRGEGFFMAVVRKEESAGPSRGLRQTGSRAGRIQGDMIRGAKEYATVKEDFIDDFSGTAIALPMPRDEFHSLAAGVKIVKAGTALVTLKQGSAVPSHDMAVSLLFKRGSLPEVSVGYDEAIRFLRNESDIGARFSEKGWITVVYRDVPLGFIKNIGPRINNYYPSEWRIRMSPTGTEVRVLI